LTRNTIEDFTVTNRKRATNKWIHCYILEAFLEDSEGTLSASSATGAAAAAAAMALSSSLLMVLADFLKQEIQ